MAESEFQVPSVEQQMADLEPSKELVDFYRSRLAKYEEETENLKLKLEKYLKISDQRHKLELDLIKKDDKIRALQKGLNDLQQCLFHEREHVLKVYSEMDKLKLQTMEGRERILELLAMTGNSDLHDKVIFIFNEPPLNISICERQMRTHADETQTKVKLASPAGITSHFERRPVKSNDLLKSEVSTLELQLEEHKKLAKEQLDAMAESYRLGSQEADARRMMDKEKIQSLSERLKKTEKLLQLSTNDFIELNKAIRRKELRWATEKDTLIQNLNSAVKNVVDSSEMKTLVNEVTEAIKAADEIMKSGSSMDILSYIVEKEKEGEPSVAKELMKTGQPRGVGVQQGKESGKTEKSRRGETEGKETATRKAGPTYHDEGKETAPKKPKPTYYEEVKVLQQELEGIRNLNKAYRGQCQKLEDALNQLKEDHQASLDLHKKTVDVLQERLKVSTTQLKRLETYRKSELEGYKTDIKHLKQKITELEKQLMKAVILFEQGDKDMELLRTVHRTTVRSKKIAGEIRLLKAKLYELEMELRNL